MLIIYEFPWNDMTLRTSYLHVKLKLIHELVLHRSNLIISVKVSPDAERSKRYFVGKNRLSLKLLALNHYIK